MTDKQGRNVCAARPPRLGNLSLVMFVLTGSMETLFITMALLMIASLPIAATETFQFSRNTGLGLLAGQLVHILAILIAVAAFLRGEDPTTAAIGAATNSVVPLAFIL